MQPPRIVEKPELKVIGYEAAFLHCRSPEATNLQVIGALWDKFIGRADRISNRTGDAMYGVIYGRPEAERAHPHELQYIAAVPVSSTAEVPEGMVSWTVPAGIFAVFTHRGPIRTIGETVSAIYRGWLPQCVYQHAETADVELYDDRFCCDGADSEMEIWIPVTPKASPA